MTIDLRFDPEYGNLTRGVSEFQEELARRNHIDPSLVRPTNGATGALSAIFSATRIRDAHQGKKSVALLASPEYFDAFRMLKMYGFDITTAANGMMRYPTSEIIEQLGSKKPTLFYVSVPNNPTGILLSDTELDQIINEAPVETRMVLDRTLVHPEQYCETSSLREKFGDRDIIIVDSFSKSLGVVSDRVGYFVGFQPETVEAVHPYAHAPSSLAMAKVRGLLDDDGIEQEVETVVKKVRESDTILRQWNKEQPKATYHPSLSNFAVIELSGISGDECRERLEEQGILVRSGSQLYMSADVIRIDMGQPKVLPEVLEKLDKILA